MYYTPRRRLLVLATSIVFTLAAVCLNAATYYVDSTNGSDGNTGLTQGEAWMTLSNVNSGSFLPGDQILLKRGERFQGPLFVDSSGAEGNLIVIADYGSGERPVIDFAAGDYAGIQIVDESFVELRNLQVVGPGIGVAGNNYAGIFVGIDTQNYVSRGVSIYDCVVKDLGGVESFYNSKFTGLISYGTSVSGAYFQDVVVDGCNVSNTQQWSGIIISVYDWLNVKSDNIVFRNCTANNVNGDGIVQFSVINSLIEWCVAYDVGLDPTLDIGTPNGIWHWNSTNSTVQFCEAYRVKSPGVDGGAFDIDWANIDVTVQYSYGHDCDGYGVAIFGAENYVPTTSGSVVRYNVFANNGREAGTNGSGQGDFKITSWNGGSIDGVKIYNNTSYWNPAGNDPAIVVWNANFVGSQSKLFKNNIIVTTNQKTVATDTNALSFDNNIYWNSLGSPYFWHTATGYTSVSSWTTATGHDANSRFIDPQLNGLGWSGVGAPTVEYKAQASSPAIDSGVDVGAMGVHDFYGVTIPQNGLYDIGASESEFPLATPLSMPGVFSDNMVVQQDTNIKLWGKSAPGETITASADWPGSPSASTTADSSGKWEVALATPPAPANQVGYTLTIQASETITFSNVLVGEVWLLSGQSNMEMPLEGWPTASPPLPVEGGPEAAAVANFPQVRLMVVGYQSSGTVKADIAEHWNLKSWTVCSPETAGDVSAVGYFFGRDIHQSLDVPVGLLQVTFSGSTCEAWTSPEDLELVDDYRGKGPFPSTGYWDNHSPGVLFNGMIAPVIPFTIRGVLWYQGEGNVGRTEQLTQLFPSMIEGWRREWGQGDFPFYFANIAPWGNHQQLPEFWEAQASALYLPNTALALTIDVGISAEIHPPKKQPIGERFARLVKSKLYGFSSLTENGPIYRSHTIEGNTLRLVFDYVGSGLNSAGSGLLGFELAGADNLFHPAVATIEGSDTVALASSAVPAPTQARYAWTNLPQPSLFNGDDLPAASFRTQPAAYLRSHFGRPLPQQSPNLIVNHGFENGVAGGEVLGWQTWGDSGADWVSSGGTAYEGNQHLTHYVAENASYSVYTYQTLTGLQNGNYSLSARVRKFGNGFVTAVLEAKNYGGLKRTVDVPSSDNYQLVELANIQVTNGSCMIGVYTEVLSGTGWPSVFVDDVVLVRTGDL